MPVAETYRRQVTLLLRVLPYVSEEACFALKGGTAINLFIRDMPRLSVDIDLAYLPVEGRSRSLAAIDGAMKRIAGRVGVGLGARVGESRLSREDAVNKLVIRAKHAQVKVEVTPVLRGCVFPPERRTVSARVEEQFGFAETAVASFADLYGGKIVAALDRQHPRDLFDVRELMAREGIDSDMRRAFVVYLLSHNRPMAEVLDPTHKDIAAEYARNFEGMTDSAVDLPDLLATRDNLIAAIVGDMPAEHRQFLVSFERGDPEWPLLGLPDIDRLPAVKWRQRNLDMLEPAERDNLVRRLEQVLLSR